MSDLSNNVDDNGEDRSRNGGMMKWTPFNNMIPTQMLSDQQIMDIANNWPGRRILHLSEYGFVKSSVNRVLFTCADDVRRILKPHRIYRLPEPPPNVEYPSFEDFEAAIFNSKTMKNTDKEKRSSFIRRMWQYENIELLPIEDDGKCKILIHLN